MTEVFHMDITECNEEAYHRMYDMLSSFAKEKIDNTKSDTLKNQRIAACHLLENSGLSVDSLTYKPVNNVYKAKDKYYSMSHSRECVCVAVSDNQVGVDVEDIKRLRHDRIRKLVNSHFFTERDRAYLGDNPSADMFLRLWTFKEAYAKASFNDLAGVIGKVDFFSDSQVETGIEKEDWKEWECGGIKYIIKYMKYGNSIACVMGCE